MKPSKFIVIIMLFAFALPAAQADRLKLKTTIIKGNKEMPQIVYIVPWKEMQTHSQQQQTLVLHSLFGGLFNPVHAAATRTAKTTKPAKTMVTRK